MNSSLPTQSKKIIFTIHGGAGKSILATAVIHALKRSRPDTEIIVLSAYPDIWKHNPDIKVALNPEQSPTIYRDYIKDQDVELMNHDPYHTEDFIYRRKHLAEIWANLVGLKNIATEPYLYISETEKEAVQRKLPNKKIFLIQTNGGSTLQRFPISWARDFPHPIAEKIAERMIKEGYAVIHLRRPEQPTLKNAQWVNLTLREMLVAISLSDKRLFIDSVGAHAAAAFKLPSVVTWIANSPVVFGHSLHTNIVPSIQPTFRHYPGSLLERYDITGALDQNPFDTEIIFNEQEIIKKLLS
jgi:hypothetical protein